MRVGRRKSGLECPGPKKMTRAEKFDFFSKERSSLNKEKNVGPGIGFLQKNREKYFLQVFRRSTIVFSANAWLYLRVF